MEGKKKSTPWRAFGLGISAESPQFCLRDNPVQLFLAGPARDPADVGSEAHAQEIEAVKGNHTVASFYVIFDRIAVEMDYTFQTCLIGKSTALYSQVAI